MPDVTEDAVVVHGRRPARPAGVDARAACRRRRPTRRRKCARACDWVSTAAGGRGAVRELIELVLRAQGRWDGGRGRARRTALMDGSLTLLAALLALLAGLAVGKAWERYKLQDGRWIDRRRGARVAALHPRAELPGRQPDRPGDRRADEGGGARRRSARDPPDPRQPVSREGPGRPRDPGAPGAAAAAEHPQARTRQRPALPRPRLQARRVRRPRARGVHRSAASSIPTTGTRCRTSRSSTRSSTSGTRPTRRGSSWRRSTAQSSRRAHLAILASSRTSSARRR